MLGKHRVIHPYLYTLPITNHQKPPTWQTWRRQTFLTSPPIHFPSLRSGEGLGVGNERVANLHKTLRRICRIFHTLSTAMCRQKPTPTTTTSPLAVCHFHDICDTKGMQLPLYGLSANG